MILKTESESEHKKKSRPFRVLPLLKNLGFKKMPKNPTLKLFTKTWPPKVDADESSRPLTATLDKPTILNINLIKVIDMSTVRKEFLHISNLCRLPIKLAITKRKKTAVVNRPLSLPSAEKALKPQNKKRTETSEQKEADEISLKSAKDTKINKLTKVDEVTKKKIINDANNNKTFKIPRKRANNITKLLEVKRDLEKSNKLPEPCKTCGRPDQPERFHSHPATPLKPAKKEEPPKMKNSVQKPVAIKYKSKQLPEKKGVQSSIQRKPSLPSQKLVHTPPNLISSTTRVKSAKRTLTCSICGREFGTASLPLHEPKCLEIKLSATKSATPSSPLPPSNVECYICGETFGTNFIKSHEKQCLKKWRFENDLLPEDSRALEPVRKHNVTLKEKNIAVKDKRPFSAKKSPMFPCYICGREFTINSIYIHEPQCLKMWKIENEKLPLQKRRPQPLKPDIKFTEDGKVDYSATTAAIWQTHLQQLVPCQFCSRTFNPDRVIVHERSCKG